MNELYVKQYKTKGRVQDPIGCPSVRMMCIQNP